MVRKRPKVRKGGKTVILITCRNCGWRWKPIPKRWRNRYNVVSERTLQCPSCGTKNRIDKATVKKIFKYNL